MERVGGITSQRMVCMKDKRFILGVTVDHALRPNSASDAKSVGEIFRN